jgi:hypothetical protein
VGEKRRDRLWLAWLLIGLLATAGYFLLPPGNWYCDIVYDAIGLASAVMMVVAVRRRRTARPAMWYWFATGQAVWVIGDLTFSYYRYVLHRESFPSPADAPRTRLPLCTGLPPGPAHAGG